MKKFNPAAPKFGDKKYDPDTVFMSPRSESVDNCYDYAVQSKIDSQIANPGELALDFLLQANTANMTANNLIRLMTKDGFAPAGEAMPKQIPGHYLAVLYVSPGNDYHLIREDKEGWSHKIGTTQPAQLTDNAGKLLSEPPRTLSPENGFKHDYALAQYFYIPKGGRDVGYEVPLETYVRQGNVKGFCEIADALKVLTVGEETKGDAVFPFYDAVHLGGVLDVPGYREKTDNLFWKHCAPKYEKESPAPQ